YWVNPLRELLLAGAALWTLRLGWGISGRYGATTGRRLVATLLVAAGAGFVVWGWALLFWLW
ncbi:MAG TPA: 4Fe-4S binding protein, partial [Plasticicumulans sp.]|nr:4Fe-4S binding protein [Plasticicumulans sp.]